MPVLFTTDRPDFYLIEQIYHPLQNPTGSVIPRPGSLVMDAANGGLLRRVVSVDETTFTPVYGPVHTALLQPEPVIDDEVDDRSSIVDYGNSRFYLLYDTSETPTKLNIDKKVVILGGDADLFEIVKYDQVSQNYFPISLYFDNGNFVGTKIPLITIDDESKVKIPTNCHTSTPISDEDVFYMFIYDYSGTQCGSVKLYAKRAVVNNTLEDDLLIEGFVIEATQIDGDELYLYPDQDPANLVITPRILFNNNTSRMIPVDNNLCHLYGLEGFTAAYPGQEVELLVKYFLDPTQQAVGEYLMSSGDTRFLARSIRLRVKDPGTGEYTLKILTVPRYVAATNRWILMFFLYNLEDNIVRDITSLVTVTPAFDGLAMGTDQNLLLEFPIRSIFPDASSNFIYHQPVVVRVNPYSWYERYILRDTSGDAYGVYGVDSPILPRPVLYFDDVLNQYYIPTSKFPNKTRLLEAFYFKARPLYDSAWLSVPPDPTHFALRSAVNGLVLTSAPIEIDNYTQRFNLVNVINQNELVGKNCIVEWMRLENGEFKVLYGAPVDAYLGV